MPVASKPSGTHNELLNAAFFKLEISPGSSISFQELGGINLEIPAVDYYCAGKKTLEHSKHFGVAKPPSLELKRGLDLDKTLWAWYVEVQSGLESAYKQCTVRLYGAGDPVGGPGRIVYELYNAWITKLNMTGSKAGSGDVIMQNLTLVCDQIRDPNVKI